MDSAKGIPVFLVCALVGCVCGVLYDCFTPLRRVKPVRVAADVAFFLCAALVYLVASVKCNFPDFRLYEYLGLSLGFLIYLKSVRRVVAFFLKMCYTIYEKAKNKFFSPLYHKTVTRFLKKRKERISQKKVSAAARKNGSSPSARGKKVYERRAFIKKRAAKKKRKVAL